MALGFGDPNGLSVGCVSCPNGGMGWRCGDRADSIGQSLDGAKMGIARSCVVKGVAAFAILLVCQRDGDGCGVKPLRVGGCVGDYLNALPKLDVLES